MLDLNPTTFAAVCEKAAHDAQQHPRWLTAIGRAILELDSNPWIERGELHGLVIGSPSGNVYAANGTCQCEAHKYGIPCWHRAAARLVRLCDEREASAAQLADKVIEIVDTTRTARKIAAARKALELVNELY